jgi:pyridoxal phosphate enzyme (YggS family)
MPTRRYPSRLFLISAISLYMLKSFCATSFKAHQNTRRIIQKPAYIRVPIMSALYSADATAKDSTPELKFEEKIECYVVENASGVRKNMEEAAIKAGRDPKSINLIPVSKTKPASDIATLYAAGYRDFGESYVQELIEKVSILPSDIQWHFIGHLQSGKASKLVREVPNLAVVQTVDSLKLASKLSNACETAGRPPLSIYIQVDTSGEDTKSGVPPSEAPALALAVREQCPMLSIIGLMTIGAPEDFTCFDKLVQSRIEVAEAMGVEPASLGYVGISRLTPLLLPHT